jgi:pimeloyl-ACP methyl ester carboxylesterase
MHFLRFATFLSAAALLPVSSSAAQMTGRGPEGCWAVNFAESDLGGAPAPKSETLCISRNTPTTLDFTVHAILPDGKIRGTSWDGAPDSKPRPLQGSSNGESDAVHRTATGLAADNSTTDGTTIHEDIDFSPDARMLAVKVAAHTPNGEKHATYIGHATALAYPVSPAVYTDTDDPANPPSMDVLHIPSHGVQINGLIYRAAGAGLHPTIVICHGLPGNEKNLDLAQAIRRAGWNAVTFNYRGSWGSPGNYRFAQNLEDVGSVLAYLRQPDVANKLGIDTKRMVLAGHSMGGWATVHTAAHDHQLLGAILISAADMGKMGALEMPKIEAEMADDMESLAGVTAHGMAEEVKANADAFRFENAVQGLAQTPMLVLSANDGLAPQTDALIQAIESNGGMKITAMHVATDHSWSDHRVGLASLIITWLEGLH